MARRVLTLAVSSSTATVAVAVISGQSPTNAEVLAQYSTLTDRRHAEEISPMIADCIRDAKVTLTDFERLAVDVGPGRFTGLRVGLATVRTFAFALGIPVVGVTSLETLAGAYPDRSVTAVIDARRAEVFQQRFAPVNETGHSRAVDEPHYGDPAAIAAEVQPGDIVVGDGADRYPNHYSRPDTELLAEQEPSAALLGLLSLTKEAKAGPQIAPMYLREPDVQVNIKTRHNT